MPEIFKTGLKHQRLSNARYAARIDEKIQGRLERFNSEDMDVAPYPDDVMDATLAQLSERVTAIMRENLVSLRCFSQVLNILMNLFTRPQASIGFSVMDGPAFIREIARWKIFGGLHH